MSELFSTIWTQVVSNTWVYVYSIFACVMIRWAWYLRDLNNSLPQNGLFNYEHPFGGEIVEEALPTRKTPGYEKTDHHDDGNPSVSA